MTKSYAWLQNLLLCGFTILASTPAIAQIIPDNTLGAESSRLTPNVTIGGENGDRIDGGATRGSNLFHSFSEFNIDDGQRVYFGNPNGIQNILTRVTGGNASNILGTLGVDGAANLFLINPNGIIFGQNASLDLRGSFVGTTANAIGFDEQGFFSATNLEAPPLLTVNPSALLFTQLNGGAIANQGFLTAGRGQSLVLAGGNIDFNKGSMAVPGGRIELAAIAGTGTVGLNPDNSLSIPTDLPRADVTLSNSQIGVTAGNNSGVAIQARNLDISGNSQIYSQIGSGLGAAGTQTGDITLNATDMVLIREGSRIRNTVAQGETGNGGDIQITAGSLFLTDDARLSVSVFGQGNAGDIIINAGDQFSMDNRAQLRTSTYGRGNGGNVTIEAGDRVTLNNDSVIFNTIEQNGIGTAGNIDISTGALSISNGAQLQTATLGQGNAGDVTINARDRVSLDGVGPAGIPSAILATVRDSGIGTGGDILINTGSLSVTNEAALTTSTLGRGDAGNITIQAGEKVMFDNDASGLSGVAKDGIGTGGDIRITAGALSISNISQLLSSTYGQGSAGNISIDVHDRVSLDKNSAISSNVGSNARGNGGIIRLNAGSLSLTNASQLQTITFGQGNAGHVIINALGDVSFSGLRFEEQGLPASGIISAVAETGIGNAGTISIDAASLSTTDFAELKTSNQGQGDAGNILINARDRVSLGLGIISNIVGDVSRPGRLGKGKGGTIRIDTGTLSMANGAQLQASTFGQGNAGDIIINARDTVSLSGSGQFQDITNPTAIFSIVADNSQGNGGNIRIGTGTLSIADGAQLSVSTSSQGRAGNISIEARDVFSLDGRDSRTGLPSTLSTATVGSARGQGGRISVNTNSFRISNSAVVNAQTTSAFQGGDVAINANTFEANQGGQIITTASNRGQAGNITLNADRISLSGKNQGVASGLFANTTGNASGRGGNIQINAGKLNISESAQVSVKSQGSGVAGNIKINADTIQLSDHANIIAETASQDGGSISIENADLVLLRRGSLISATAAEGGNGGNVTINAKTIVALPNENSDISANAFQGRGGNVQISTQGIFGIQQRSQLTELSDITASSELGVSGQISITEPNVQPTQGLVELPASVLDASDQIAQTCPNGATANRPLGEFVVTGRGGSLPPNPLELLAGTTSLSPLASLDGERTANLPKTSSAPAIPRNSQTAIIEAQGWVRTAAGKIALVASAPQATPLATTAQATCPVPK